MFKTLQCFWIGDVVASRLPDLKASAGDGTFFVVKVMSGGQSASVVFAMWNEIAMLQYPSAAASSVVLMVIVTLMVAAILLASELVSRKI